MRKLLPGNTHSPQLLLVQRCPSSFGGTYMSPPILGKRRVGRRQKRCGYRGFFLCTAMLIAASRGAEQLA